MLRSVDRYTVKGVSTKSVFFMFTVNQFKKALALTLKTKATKSFQTMSIVYHKTCCGIQDKLSRHNLVDHYWRLEEIFASKFREVDFKNIEPLRLHSEAVYCIPHITITVPRIIRRLEVCRCRG